MGIGIEDLNKLQWKMFSKDVSSRIESLVIIYVILSMVSTVSSKI